MIYEGHIKQGHIILDEPVPLPDGTAVVVQLDERLSAGQPVVSLPLLFGSVRSGDARSADNERIDADLADEYAGKNHSGE